MWPSDITDFLKGIEPEPLFAFLVALVVWVFTEFKRSEEVIFRESTPNDILLGRRLIGYGAFQFREMLRDHDFKVGLGQRYFTETDGFTHEVSIGIAHFQDKKLKTDFDQFAQRLRKFLQALAVNTSPEGTGDSTMLYVRNPRTSAPGWTDVQKREAEELNAKASEAWESLEKLIGTIRTRVPEVMDDPVHRNWFHFEPENQKAVEKMRKVLTSENFSRLADVARLIS